MCEYVVKLSRLLHEWMRELRGDAETTEKILVDRTVSEKRRRKLIFMLVDFIMRNN